MHAFPLMILVACTGTETRDDGPPDVPLHTDGTVALDLDDDGFADVVRTAPSGTGVVDEVWFGGPDGLSAGRTAVLTREFAQSERPCTICGASWAGDVNGDGFADVVTNDLEASGASGVVVYYGGPRDALPEGRTLDHGRTLASNLETYGSLGTRAGDVNGDGLDDLVWLHRPHVLSLHYGREGELSPTPDVVLDTSANGGLVPEDWPDYDQLMDVRGVGDVDGDGHADVVVQGWVNAPTGSAGVLLLGGPSGWTVGPELPWRGPAGAVGFADLDGDGRTDVVRSPGLQDVIDTPDQNNGGYGAIHRGGSGSLDGTAQLLLGMPEGFPDPPGDGPPISDLSVGPDVNGDGLPDVWLAAGVRGRRTAPAADHLWLALWSGGAPEPSGHHEGPDQVQHAPFPEDWPEAGAFPMYASLAGDLDGDGFGDAIATQDGLTWWIYRGARNGLFTDHESRLQMPAISRSVATSGR